MKTKLNTYFVLALAVCCIMLLAAASVFLWNRPTRIVSELESTVARIPIGVSAEEADSIMGGEPDEISEVDGVLMTPVTMLAVSNELAKKYGEPKTYTLRIWKRDGTRATVALDADGNVAGHWAWSE
jgi:hypothetical protein